MQNIRRRTHYLSGHFIILIKLNQYRHIIIVHIIIYNRLAIYETYCTKYIVNSQYKKHVSRI